jgi:hypothetical protein
MRYEIIGYMQNVTYEKCWLEVEADSEEHALDLAKEGKADFIGSKCIDVSSEEYCDFDEWKVYK